MFECKDSQGKQLHTDDIVRLVSPTPNGTNNIDIDGKPIEAYVITIYSETEVCINPVNIGKAEVVPNSILEVIYSPISELAKLSSSSDLQRILLALEENANLRLQHDSSSKKPRKVRTEKVESEFVEVEL